MSLYTRAVSGADIGDDTYVGFSIKRGLKKAARKTGRVTKRVGKVAALSVIPPVGIAYVAHKAIKNRKAKKRASANSNNTPSPDGSGDFPDDIEDGNNEEDADEDEDSDAESGDSTMADEIGWDEIGDDVDAMLGDDVGDSYVGAARRGAAPQRRGPNSMQVRQNTYSKAREYPLGFSSAGTIAAAGSATITAAPQTLFRPKRLVIPSSIAGSFTIQDIKVGNQSQLVASGSLPAALYSELAVGTMQRYDTAPPGILISLSVTNTSAGALAFSAAMVGDSVQ